MPKKRAVDPKDYLWCEPCQAVVHVKHAKKSVDIFEEGDDALCPDCGTALVPYKE